MTPSLSGLLILQSQQVPSLHTLWCRDSSQSQNSGGNIYIEGHVAFSNTPLRTGCPRIVNEHRHPNRLLIDEPLARQSVLAEKHPVVAHEDDHRIVVYAQPFELVDHIADHIVDLCNQPVIVFNVVLILLGGLEPGTPAIAGFARFAEKLRKQIPVLIASNCRFGNLHICIIRIVTGMRNEFPGISILCMRCLEADRQAERLLFPRKIIEKTGNLPAHAIRMVIIVSVAVFIFVVGLMFGLTRPVVELIFRLVR